MKQVATISWNAEEASKALGIKLEDHLDCQTDGRKASALAIDWLANNGWEKVYDGLSGWFLRREGKTFKLRILTTTLSFSPSKSKGVGRRFRSSDFSDSLSKLSGFLVLDALDLPSAPVYEISREQVDLWMQEGTLDRSANLSRKTFATLVKSSRG